jgi:3,4-dihydroxy 2-butanone 4-phosphate synthase/GTP cyclohydrolase II
MKHTAYSSVHNAIKALQEGKMVLLTDPIDRENEGDFVFPAENITPEVMNFMIRHGSGIVCVSLTEERLKQLNIPLMIPTHQNTTQYHSPFTVSVEAKNGVTTGVSAADRTRTVETLMDPQTNPQDIARPGHIFPLQAQAGGVLVRTGHTEGAMDIVKLAGFQPAAVICEATNEDGTMVKGQELKALAEKHNMALLSIDDLIHYRLSTENLIEDTAEATLPTEHFGEWKIQVIREKYTQKEHTLLVKKFKPDRAPLVRIHSCCLTGDLFGSLRCDCKKQLDYSMQKISEEGGILIYLNQEGRGIGLFNKIRAYALQEKGLDTVEANLELGFPADSRNYYIVSSILREIGIDRIRLLTNNPKKINELKASGFEHVERAAMPTFTNPHNEAYLSTKKERLQHLGE